MDTLLFSPGKTYTLYGALEYISTRLVGKSIRITFYEVHGKRCYDLLSNRNVVHLRSDEHENMHVRGARSIELYPLRDPLHLIEVLKEALSLRSSKVTERNPISSRSHAVCTIELFADGVVPPTTTTAATPESKPAAVPINKNNKSLGNYLASKQFAATCSASGLPVPPPAATSAAAAPVHCPAPCGKITLVDLAGSERNYETTQMTAAQHKESADINFALMALKDCFRAYHSHLTRQLVLLDNQLHGGGGVTSGAGAAMTPNLFNSTTNATGVVKSIHSVGLISSTKAIALNSAALAAAKGSASVPTPIHSASESSTAGDDVRESNQHSPPSVTSMLAECSNSKAAEEDNCSAAAAATSNAPAAVRIPFRSSLLTKVLKQCFTSGPHHRTTIMATISPTPIDLQHSLNTLNHVVLMCPELQQLTHRLTVEVALNMHVQMAQSVKGITSLLHHTGVGSGLSTKAVAEWSATDVIAWLATAERGHFSHVILPPGIDGAGLLQLSATNFADIFAAQQQNVARGDREGAAWVETVADGRKVRRLGRALWSALRREMQSTRARESQLLQSQKSKVVMGGANGVTV